MTENATWIRVCSSDELPDNSARGFKIDKLELAVYSSDGKLYASSDICSHQREFLSDGYLEGCEIECPRHGARFSLQTGEALSLPATSAIEVFSIERRGDEIFVAVPTHYLVRSES
jgi:nitrite reductase/ring-hydroxylating ferredoxin subunit